MREDKDHHARVTNQAATNAAAAAERTIVKGQAVSNNTVSSIVSSTRRFKGGARLMQLAKQSQSVPSY